MNPMNSLWCWMMNDNEIMIIINDNIDNLLLQLSFVTVARTRRNINHSDCCFTFNFSSPDKYYREEIVIIIIMLKILLIPIASLWIMHSIGFQPSGMGGGINIYYIIVDINNTNCWYQQLHYWYQELALLISTIRNVDCGASFLNWLQWNWAHL